MPINNPVMFIGEVVSGATPGAPLSVSAGNQLVSGVSNQEVSATAGTTQTSATPAVISGMTITPAAGTYLVMFSAWVTHNTASDTISIAIYAGGTQKADSVRTVTPFPPGGGGIGGTAAAAIDLCVATQGIVTVNGSQAITIEWATSGGTATANQRTMDIVRLA